jgi:hypothetical protein
VRHVDVAALVYYSQKRAVFVQQQVVRPKCSLSSPYWLERSRACGEPMDFLLTAVEGEVSNQLALLMSGVLLYDDVEGGKMDPLGKERERLPLSNLADAVIENRVRDRNPPVPMSIRSWILGIFARPIEPSSTWLRVGQVLRGETSEGASSPRTKFACVKQPSAAGSAAQLPAFDWVFGALYPRASLWTVSKSKSKNICLRVVVICWYDVSREYPKATASRRETKRQQLEKSACNGRTIISC